METKYIMPVEVHDRIIEGAFEKRGFTKEEAKAQAKIARLASWHGIQSHNGLKALHLDDLFGSKSKVKSCVPGAEIEVIENFGAAQLWNAHMKPGPAVAFKAMDAAREMADKHGIGIVNVDEAFHYLWGGGYVMDMANKGYFAHTNCTSTLAEVVPSSGKYPTLGTNPHSDGFPTQDIIGFPIVTDFASSKIAMGKVAVAIREGQELPPGSAIDKDGNETTDPNKVYALLPAAMHKGYMLALKNEIYGAFIGGDIPTRRGTEQSKKPTSVFYFQVIHPKVFNSGNYVEGKTQPENVKAVLDDILGHGNREAGSIFPGEIEARGAKLSEKHGGLLFTEAEYGEFRDLADSVGVSIDGMKSTSETDS